MNLKKYYLILGIAGLVLTITMLTETTVPKSVGAATTVPLGKNGTSQYLLYPTDSLTADRYIATSTTASSTFQNVEMGQAKLGTLNGLLTAATGFVSTIATSSLGLPTFATLNDYLSLSTWYATTTDGLDEGTTNKYDKTVAFTNGTNVSMTGTYPNFTIADSLTPAFTTLTAGGMLATSATTTSATSTNLFSTYGVFSSLNVSSGATTTFSIVSSSASKGSCLKLQDTSGGTFTYVWTQSGVLYSSATSCQ